jgi:hypothetical protein
MRTPSRMVTEMPFSTFIWWLGMLSSLSGRAF